MSEQEKEKIRKNINDRFDRKVLSPTGLTWLIASQPEGIKKELGQWKCWWGKRCTAQHPTDKETMTCKFCHTDSGKEWPFEVTRKELNWEQMKQLCPSMREEDYTAYLQKAKETGLQGLEGDVRKNKNSRKKGGGKKGKKGKK